MNIMSMFTSKWKGIPVWVFFVLGVGALALYINKRKKNGNTKAAANQSATDLGSASALANLFQEAWPMSYMGGDVYINNTNAGPGANVTPGGSGGSSGPYAGPGGRIGASGPPRSPKTGNGIPLVTGSAAAANAQTNSIINQSMPSVIPSFAVVGKSLSTIGTINGSTANSGAGMIPNRATVSTGKVS